MLPLNFRIAMFNRLGVGPYEHPGTIDRSSEEWLIVERRDLFLKISRGSLPASPACLEAPEDITVDNTLFGQFVESNSDTNEDVFLLTRGAARRSGRSKNFFPASGYARLSKMAGKIKLAAHGRQFLRTEPIPARGATSLMSPQLEQETKSFNWHFDAIQYYWVQEFCGFSKRVNVQCAAL